jgi:imidazolonepropionase-like amidohydrolase
LQVEELPLPKLVLKGEVFTGSELIEDGVVVVDQSTGIIEDVGKQGEVDEPGDQTRIIADKGTAILPGLIDTHLHFLGTPGSNIIDPLIVPEPQAALRSVRDLHRLLYAGFTTVRDLGSKVGTYLSQAVKEGIIEGPRVISASRPLSRTGGDDEPSMLPLPLAKKISYSYHCDGPWECRKAVRKVIRDGGEAVKLFASGLCSQERKGHVHFTVEELKAIVDEAHIAGLKVAAHVWSEEGLMNVVEAGVDSIEHGMWLTPEIADGIKKKGIFYVPTLSVFRATRSSRANAYREKFIERHFAEDMEIAKQYNLKIVSGSDYFGADIVPHGQNYMEIVSLANYLGNAQAIVAATSRAAECLGLSNTGQVKKGFDADLIVVRGNPLTDLEAISPGRISHVVKNGKTFSPNG